MNFKGPYLDQKYHSMKACDYLSYILWAFLPSEMSQPKCNYCEAVFVLVKISFCKIYVAEPNVGDFNSYCFSCSGIPWSKIRTYYLVTL